MKPIQQRKQSLLFGPVSLLLSALLLASCMPISPLSFPLNGGPTPPVGAPLAAPGAATVVASTLSTTPATNTVATTETVARAAPTAEPAADTVQAVAGLGGLASATSAVTSTAQITAPAPSQVAIPKPVPPINPITMATLSTRWHCKTQTCARTPRPMLVALGAFPAARLCASRAIDPLSHPPA